VYAGWRWGKFRCGSESVHAGVEVRQGLGMDRKWLGRGKF